MDDVQLAPLLRVLCAELNLRKGLNEAESSPLPASVEREYRLRGMSMRRRRTDSLQWLPPETIVAAVEDHGSTNGRILPVADKETVGVVWNVYRRHLVNHIRHESPQIGRMVDVDVTQITSEEDYQKRAQILSLIDRNLLVFLLSMSRTHYFREAKGFLAGVKRCIRCRRIYKSIRKNGLKWDPSDPYSVPWLFAAREGVVRVDGHHRAATARFIGYSRIKVFLLTPSDLLKVPGIDDRCRAHLSTLHEPVLDQPESRSLSRPERPFLDQPERRLIGT